jgi:O-succinylbenzoic acid--CoA ligase
MNKPFQKSAGPWHTNINQLLAEPRPSDAYLANAYDFMQLWITGTEHFTLQTSGSTGTPKVINITRSQMASSAAMTGQALQLGSGTRALVCLNTNYVAGLMMLVRGLELNWELTIVQPVSNPIQDLRQEFDFTALVPMQLMACLENDSTRPHVSDLGKILLGGAPVSLTLRNEIEKLQQPVFQSYGMTETVSHVALRRLNGKDHIELYTLLPSVQAGKDDRDCLWVAGPMTNQEMIQTNDLVEFESENSFRWLGRADNVINSGGVKIILDRIDEVVSGILYEIGESAALFSWHEPDEKLGQKLVLFIESERPKLDSEMVIKEIRKHLSAFEIPKHVYFVDRFLKTQTDKIDRRLTASTFFNRLHG